MGRSDRSRGVRLTSSALDGSIDISDKAYLRKHSAKLFDGLENRRQPAAGGVHLTENTTPTVPIPDPLAPGTRRAAEC